MQLLTDRNKFIALVLSAAVITCSAQPSLAAIADGTSPIASAGNAHNEAYSVQSARTQEQRTEHESDTWKTVLIGLGLIAFQLRRTQRLLHHRPLAH